MRTPITKAIAAFGGAAAVVLAVGIGAGGVSPTGDAPSAATHPSPGVTTTQPGTPAPGVHIATLAGCIPGANC
ncbi:hypothetical protein MYCO108962_03140 [Mycobacterium colombiense]|uniref:Uncharacterized protein n=1 Tax=Mycobacterium colombiense CECT 3035 TaxID=1041522 RepID=J4TKI1_9MYCO|nr:hypothetical protein [Mycobacterium colombiense]EJO90298.1 hypothetical protein MCOL_V208915 [Mycobacterium colombiense CECT 3035]MCK8644056.1 hypothetical protein [Mycobacterium colombiense]